MFCLVLLEKNMHAQQNPSQDQEAGALNKTTTTTGPRQRSPCLDWFRRWGPEANLPTSWARYGRSRVVSPHTSCRVTISIRGLNRLCQSSYVTARCCCPAPDCIWGIKRRFDICLDLNACALSYFWKERACDGLSSQPALLTRDRVTKAACSGVTEVEQEADFDLQCGNQREKKNPPSDTVLDFIRLWFSLHFQVLFTPFMLFVFSVPEYLLTALRKPVAFHKKWAFVYVKRLKVF